MPLTSVLLSCWPWIVHILRVAYLSFLRKGCVCMIIGTMERTEGAFFFSFALGSLAPSGLRFPSLRFFFWCFARVTFLLVRHTKWVVNETQVVFFCASRGFLENGSWVWMVHSSDVTGKAFGERKGEGERKEDIIIVVGDWILHGLLLCNLFNEQRKKEG